MRCLVSVTTPKVINNASNIYKRKLLKKFIYFLNENNVDWECKDKMSGWMIFNHYWIEFYCEVSWFASLHYPQISLNLDLTGRDDTWYQTWFDVFQEGKLIMQISKLDTNGNLIPLRIEE
jgi:hypothetical protein